MSRNYWMTLAAASAVTLPMAAHAGAPDQQDRTASWYAAHDAVRERVIAVCRDDPGHGHNNPDCINASQAQYIVALRDSKEHGVVFKSPADPAYWAGRPPAEIAQQAAICAKIPESAQEANYCPAFRAAMRR